MGSTQTYDDFFKATLKKFGVDSPAELSDEKKKEFFDYIDNNWTAKNETAMKELIESDKTSNEIISSLTEERDLD